MQRQILIGLIAGMASALLFTTAVATPAPLRILLFLITPLPVFIAGLSAGWVVAVYACITGGLALALLAAPAAGAMFAGTQLLPAAVLCYFALLYRDHQTTTPQTTTPSGSTSQTQSREWYPVGRIVLWAIAIAIFLSIVALAIAAADMDQLKTLLRERIDALIDAQLPKGEAGAAISQADRAYMTEITLSLLPAAFCIAITGTLLLNLWLAGRITRAQGRLARPWPDIASLTYPPGIPLALAASLVGAWTLTGIPGLAASAAAGALFFAYMILGLAIIHHVTRGYEWRPFALAAVYVSLIVFNSVFWILIVLIGLAEPVSPVRREFIRDQHPPPDNEN